MKSAVEQKAGLDALAREVVELRPLPTIAARLLRMAEDRKSSAEDLATTISADAALTVSVLRVANSPLYGMPRRISSIRESVILLGFREVRKLALASCIVQAAGNPGAGPIDYERFWRNSLGIGLLAQVLATAEGQDADAAFTAGVVHNIGRLALAQARPREFTTLVQIARAQGRSLPEVEEAELGFADADLGAAIVRRWTFPEWLCEAVANHNRPLSNFTRRSDLDSIVARARRFIRAQGLTDGIDPPAALAPDLDWQEPRVVAQLNRAGGFSGILQVADSLMGRVA